jgi:hypothetical protein
VSESLSVTAITRARPDLMLSNLGLPRLAILQVLNQTPITLTDRRLLSQSLSQRHDEYQTPKERAEEANLPPSPSAGISDAGKQASIKQDLAGWS